MPDPERAAFINAILDNLADDTVRLVFADWLEEHGEPERAEFIRLQIEAAKLPKAQRDKSKPSRRAAELEAQYGGAWREAAGFWTHQGKYVRGFLTNLNFFMDQPLALARQWLAVEPATLALHLQMFRQDAPTTFEDVDSLASNPILRAVTSIGGSGISAEWFAHFIKSLFLRNLRDIGLFESIGPEGLTSIADAPADFAIETLDLHSCIGDFTAETDTVVESVTFLATAPRFASLKFLGLRANGIGNRCVRVLLASKTLPTTLRLDLEANLYEADFAEALAERFTGGSDKEE